MLPVNPYRNHQATPHFPRPLRSDPRVTPGRRWVRHRLPAGAATASSSSSLSSSSPDMAASAEVSGLSDEAAYGACSEPDASTKVGWMGVTRTPRGHPPFAGRTCGGWEAAWGRVVSRPGIARRGAAPVRGGRPGVGQPGGLGTARLGFTILVKGGSAGLVVATARSVPLGGHGRPRRAGPARRLRRCAEPWSGWG